jgi:hypothetical protein
LASANTTKQIILQLAYLLISVAVMGRLNNSLTPVINFCAANAILHLTAFIQSLALEKSKNETTRKIFPPVKGCQSYAMLMHMKISNHHDIMPYVSPELRQTIKFFSFFLFFSFVNK